MVLPGWMVSTSVTTAKITELLATEGVERNQFAAGHAGLVAGLPEIMIGDSWPLPRILLPSPIGSPRRQHLAAGGRKVGGHKLPHPRAGPKHGCRAGGQRVDSCRRQWRPGRLGVQVAASWRWRCWSAMR